LFTLSVALYTAKGGSQQVNKSTKAQRPPIQKQRQITNSTSITIRTTKHIDASFHISPYSSSSLVSIASRQTTRSPPTTVTHPNEPLSPKQNECQRSPANSPIQLRASLERVSFPTTTSSHQPYPNLIESARRNHREVSSLSHTTEQVTSTSGYVESSRITQYFIV
jgi:hypothetical protein